MNIQKAGCLVLYVLGVAVGTNGGGGTAPTIKMLEKEKGHGGELFGIISDLVR